MAGIASKICEDVVIALGFLDRDIRVKELEVEIKSVEKDDEYLEGARGCIQRAKEHRNRVAESLARIKRFS